MQMCKAQLSLLSCLHALSQLRHQGEGQLTWPEKLLAPVLAALEKPVTLPGGLLTKPQILQSIDAAEGSHNLTSDHPIASTAKVVVECSNSCHYVSISHSSAEYTSPGVLGQLL